MEAYVYLPECFVPGLAFGKVRIGTAAMYRFADGKSGGRGDIDDMLVEWHPLPGRHVLKGTHPFISAIRANNPPEGEIGIITEEGTFFQISADAHIFCMSTLRKRTVQYRMKRTFGHNASYKILDVDAFAGILSESAGLNPPSILPMRYYRRDRPNRDEVPDLDQSVKNPAYKWQSELRIIWKAQNALPIEVCDLRLTRVISDILII